MMAWLAGLELPLLFKEIGICRQALTIIQDPHDITDALQAKPLKVTRGEIVFDHVTFHYLNHQNLFEDKTISLQAGQKVGLVGFSGSGKSTFANLILRYYDVQGGRILIDGQDISKVTQNSLREQISMIPQDPSLFHRSLMENIRYGRLDATDEEVIEASKKAHCHDFIQKMPEKYHALVGERGVKLSGGQRQRIAIARAILKNAPILILDEATSALDSVTEREIQEGLEILMEKHTTLVIAHRLSTLSGMDRILVFNEGKIVEDGTHEELIKSGGHYARMWDMQAGGFLPETSQQDEEEFS
jgi:ATP-binding cassette subfamily B protein